MKGDVSDADLSAVLVFLIALSVAVNGIAAQTLGPDGVTNAEVRLLATIRHQRGITPSQLATRVGASRSVISHSLSRFQESGLVEKERDPLDGRSFRVGITAKGKRRTDAFEAGIGRVFAARRDDARRLLPLLGGSEAWGVGETDELPPLTVAQQMSGAGSAYVADVTPLVAPLGVQMASDRFALDFLRHHGDLRPAELAQRLDLTPSGTSVLLDRLESAGLIHRNRPETGDRRAVVVRLTDRGERVCELTTESLARHKDLFRRALESLLRVRVRAGAA